MQTEIALAAVGSRSKTMSAAVLVRPGHFEIKKVPLPAISENQVLVRIEGCGVCASNIPPFEGKPWFQYPMEPGALGHESWGTVECTGEEVRDLAPGDRVVPLSTHSFAEMDVADADAVIKLPDFLEGEPFPAEPLACALNVYRRSGVEPGDTVAIVGIGFLGALLTQLATASGARVIAISRRPFALEFAKTMGAHDVLEMSGTVEISDRVKQLTGGKLCDVVFEAVGKQLPLDLAAELTRERGRLVIAGYHQDGTRQINMQLWNWRGIDVINAHERDPNVYRAGVVAAIGAVASGTLDPSPLYTHRFPLRDLGTALESAKTRPDGFMKALICIP